MRFVPAFTVLQELSPTAEMALAFEEELKAEEEERREEDKAPRLSEEDVRASYEEGYGAGYAAADAEHQDALDLQKEQTDKRIADAQAEWMSKFGNQVVVGLKESLAAIREEIAKDVAATVLPFIDEKLQERAISDLSATIAETVDALGTTTVTITGPQLLVDALKAKLPQNWIIREKVSEEEVELTAQVDTTVLTARISGWLNEITGGADGR
ncbi:MAG: hypothetical protein RIC14_08960 [Filomicrobium sp.]